MAICSLEASRVTYTYQTSPRSVAPGGSRDWPSFILQFWGLPSASFSERAAAASSRSSGSCFFACGHARRLRSPWALTCVYETSFREEEGNTRTPRPQSTSRLAPAVDDSTCASRRLRRYRERDDVSWLEALTVAAGAARGCCLLLRPPLGLDWIRTDGGRTAL